MRGPWKAMGIFFWALILVSCNTPSLSDEKLALRPARKFPMEPDRLRKGDVMAEPSDFRIYPNTLFCSLGFADPKLQAVMDATNPKAKR